MAFEPSVPVTSDPRRLADRCCWSPFLGHVPVTYGGLSGRDRDLDRVSDPGPDCRARDCDGHFTPGLG
jgi:hypothetical protein